MFKSKLRVLILKIYKLDINKISMDEEKRISDIKEIKAEQLVKEVEKEIKAEEKVQKKDKLDDFEERFREILRKTSSGTKFREALDRIAEGESGALIVLANQHDVNKIIQGGFKLNCKFTGERLFELAKMDGAIILDPQLTKIYHANALLIPNPTIPSKETGTRHQAAERTAKQTNQLVVAVSSRTKHISLYYGDVKYTLKTIGSLMTRLQSVLDSISEQKKIFENLLGYLNIMEFTGLTTPSNISSSIQKAELIIRGNNIAKRFLNELGSEGHLLDLRLKEIMKNVERNSEMIIRDYKRDKNYITIRKEIAKLNHTSLLDAENISKIFGFKTDENLEPKGYRMLSKIPELDSKQIVYIIKKHQTLKEILNMTTEDFKKIPGINEKKAQEIKKKLMKQKDSAMISQGI